MLARAAARRDRRRVPRIAISPASLAERRLGATVHVLDDGFQHVQLARDLDVLVTSRGRDPERTRAAVRPAARIDRRRGARAPRRRGGRGSPQRRAPRPGRSASASLCGGAAACCSRAPARAASRCCARCRDRQPGAVLREAPRRRLSTSARTMAFRRSPSLHGVGRRARSPTRRARRGPTRVVTTEKDAVRLEPLGPLPFACDRGADDAASSTGWDDARRRDRTPRSRGRGSATREAPARVRRRRRPFARVLGVLPHRGGPRRSARGRAAVLRRSIAPHRRVALANLAQCFPLAHRGRAPRDRARRCSRTSAACSSRC